MTALPLDTARIGSAPRGPVAPTVFTPAPVPARRDGLLTVRVAQLPRFDGSAALAAETSEVLFDQKLLVGYIAALARRAACAVRDGLVSRFDRHPHDHPDHVACLRCAILGGTDHQTLAVALLAILAVENTDEDWNVLPSCTDRKIISRLRKLAVSEEKLTEIYGPNWCLVLLTALRAESADLERMAYITRDHQDTVPPLSDYEAVPGAVAAALASYHLGTIAAPRDSLRNPIGTYDLARNQISKRLAAALARISAGETVDWIDLLPEPTL